MSATTAAPAFAPTPPRAAPGRGLRLRDHGVTPLFLAVVATLTICVQLGTVAFILLLLHLTDGVMDSRNTDTLAAFAILFAAVVATCGVYTAIRSTLLAAVAERLGVRLRAEAMQAAVRSAVRTDAADGVALLQDISLLQRFLRGPGPVMALEMLGAMAPLAFLFYFDTGLGLIGVGGILAAALVGAVLHLATRGLVAEARRRQAQTAAELGGQLVHPDLVRGLGMLWATMLRWQPRYDAALGGAEDVKKRVNSIQDIETLVFTLYEIALKGYVCYLIILHVAPLGLLFAANFMGLAAVGPFGSLARNWESWAFTLQAWRRVRAAMRDHGPPAVAPPDPSAPPGLVMERLAFAPPGRPQPIIDDLTLRLPPGTAVTVEGANGVGKSTLLRLVLGLMPPTSGRVMLDGQDSYHCDRAAFGARVGYLPQDVQLLEGSVFHNIGRGPDAAPEAVVQAARAAGAHDMIGRLPEGYQTPSGATSGLSAGQRRLIGLARAVYGEPRLRVLDEPGGGLDGYARVAMRAAVAAARARGGVVLIVTHEPDTWRGAADLRLLLSAGGGWRVQPAGDAGPTMGAERAEIR
jgi:ATP-binding cassette subfamily C protein